VKEVTCESEEGRIGKERSIHLAGRRVNKEGLVLKKDRPGGCIVPEKGEEEVGV